MKELARIDPEALLMKAVETGQGVETLERLLALRERLQAEFAASRYRQSLRDFQEGCPKVIKSKVVADKEGDERYRYASFESILDTAKPLLHANGFAFSFDTQAESGAVMVIITVLHVDGHETQSRFRVPIDPKSFMSEPQKYESAMSFAQRICFRNAFGIVTGTNDDNTEEEVKKVRSEEVANHQPLPATPAPPPIGSGSAGHKALEARITELGLARDAVKIWIKRRWGVEHFPELNHQQLRVLMDKLLEFAIKKLRQGIETMSEDELVAFIKAPPAWLLPMTNDLGLLMETADTRLTALQNAASLVRIATHLDAEEVSNE